ncbi:hypothetical protein FRB99_007493 [Tulasnella sp. 403]|nr:hypothetical protein FRB99_007493 [Tulasnella sp. 403]
MDDATSALQRHGRMAPRLRYEAMPDDLDQTTTPTRQRCGCVEATVGRHYGRVTRLCRDVLDRTTTPTDDATAALQGYTRATLQWDDTTAALRGYTGMISATGRHYESTPGRHYGRATLRLHYDATPGRRYGGTISTGRQDGCTTRLHRDDNRDRMMLRLRYEATPGTLPAYQQPTQGNMPPPEGNLPSPPLPHATSPHPVTVEEVPDEDEDMADKQSENNEAAPDYITEEHPTGGMPCREGKSTWVQEFETQASNNQEPWTPYQSLKEWELADWLAKNTTSQAAVDQFLKLAWVKDAPPLSFHDASSFYKKIDELPKGPHFEHRLLTIHGDLRDEDGNQLTEDLELWYRDPVECVKELLGNPAFKDNLSYKPTCIQKGSNGKRVYNEACTGDWWWEVQDKLPTGATVAPIILASDKTQLSVLSGDKTAWPVYLTLGKISKHIRRQPSKRATVLLGYLPVAKLGCWSSNKRREIRQDLFHSCMRQMLESLIEAGNTGVEMACADNYVRHVFPILSAYMADFPEQCLVGCTKENHCPTCPVSPENRGDLPLDPHGNILPSYLRHPDKSANIINAAFQKDQSAIQQAEHLGLRIVNTPFWQDLPHTNIFTCFTPDILHQLHKGVFKTHLFSWCEALMEEQEVDNRYKAMPHHPGLRSFKDGISHISQWTGNEYKQMERIFLGVIANAVPRKVAQAAKALLNFIYLAQYSTLSEDDLERMDASLKTFYQFKHIFVQKGIREDFNIPKFHALILYTFYIRLHGTPDGYNTEVPERLHIDLAKYAFRRSNKKEYLAQMTRTFTRLEAISIRQSYIYWRKPEVESHADVIDDDDVIIDDTTPIPLLQIGNGVTVLAGETSEEVVAKKTEEIEEAADPGGEVTHMAVSTFKVAKKAPLQRIPGGMIINDFKAPGFLDHLKNFLKQSVHHKRKFLTPV